MDPQSRKLELKVGIFIAIGLILAMVSILLLGGDKSLLTRYVYLNARFSEVQGLFPGSVVSLAGVPVGNIREIKFVPSENKLEVNMKIDRTYAHRLVEGTVAEVRTQGALGDKFVYLIPGAPGAKSLQDGALVESTETDFMKLLTSREDGVARVVDLIKELHVLVGTVNASGVMKNAGEATAAMKTTMRQLDALLGDLRGEIPENKKLRKALVSLSNVLEKIDQGKGTLGQLINDPSVHQSLKAFLGGSPRNRYMKDMIRETIQKSDSR